TAPPRTPRAGRISGGGVGRRRERRTRARRTRHRGLHAVGVFRASHLAGAADDADHRVHAVHVRAASPRAHVGRDLPAHPQGRDPRRDGGGDRGHASRRRHRARRGCARDHLRLAHVGHRHHQPPEDPPRRGTALSGGRRLLLLVVAVVGVAGVWAGGAVLLLPQIDARHDAPIDVVVQRGANAVDEQQNALLREATLLAQDPAVIDGAHKGDWATLARGAARLRALTLERVADVVVVQDIGGGTLLQVPPAPRLTLPAFAPPAKVRATFAAVDGRTYLLAVAAVGGEPGGGVVIVGRHVDRLDPQLGGTGLVVVNGDTLRYSTLPDTPKDGWTDATAAGERVLAG